MDFIYKIGCKQILVDADRCILHGVSYEPCDTANPPQANDTASPAGTILRTVFLLLSLFTLYLLLATCHFLYAGGMIYWTPNGVLVNDFDNGVGGLVDDGKGGAILFSIRLYGIGQDSVVALRIDSNGNSLWGLQGKTLDNYAGWQGKVKGVSDGRDGAIAVWSRFPPQPKLYYQRVDSMGNRMWGANAQRVTLSDSGQWYPVIVSDGAKGIIIAWREVRDYARGMDIYAQRIDSNGVRQWGDYGVAVCTADSNQEYPAITCDINGASVIVWTDLRNGSYDIFAQRLNSNGAPLWQVNGIAICDTIGAQGLTTYGTNVVMATDTTGILTWSDDRYGFANQDAYAQCINSNGLPLWIQQGVPVCDTVNRQGGGQIIADGRGGAIICWRDTRDGYRHLYAQRLNSNGQKLWLNQGLLICNADTCLNQRIVSDGKSGAIICWQDKRSGNWDVYAQHIDSLSNILWDTNGMPVCTVVDPYERYPEMIASDSNTAIICWTDFRSGNGRGYAQKVGDEIIGIAENMNRKLKVSRIELRLSPNPSSHATAIEYYVRHNATYVGLKVYDITGKLVRDFSSSMTKQSGCIAWLGDDDRGKDLPNGIYFCRLIEDGKSIMKKLILLK